MLSMGELAELMEVSVKTIQRRIAAGELHVHRTGRIVRIAEDDAIAFLAATRK
jgi:excisionase family DNA binding protein